MYILPRRVVVSDSQEVQFISKGLLFNKIITPSSTYVVSEYIQCIAGCCWVQYVGPNLMRTISKLKNPHSAGIVSESSKHFARAKVREKT